MKKETKVIAPSPPTNGTIDETEIKAYQEEIAAVSKRRGLRFTVALEVDPVLDALMPTLRDRVRVRMGIERLTT